MSGNLKKSNELIKVRKRKAMLRRSLIMIIFFVIVLCTLCLKLPYFNISHIVVLNNKNISSESIKKLSGIGYDNNIFYINTSNIKTNICSNPYILKVSVKRQLPSTVILQVQERDAVFYIKSDSDYIVLDSMGIMLETRKDIDNMKLIALKGYDYQEAVSGKVLKSAEDRKLQILMNLAQLIKRNSSPISFSEVNIENISSINIHINDMIIKLGSEFNMEEKLNKALNIIIKEDIQTKRGYVDVSFEGNPVFYLEK